MKRITSLCLLAIIALSFIGCALPKHSKYQPRPIDPFPQAHVSFPVGPTTPAGYGPFNQ